MLTDTAIKKAKPRDKSYKLSDAFGMYLEVMPNGAKYWRLKYRFLGKEKRLALGVYPEISLAAARKKRDEARKSLEENKDPSVERKRNKLTQTEKSANTFEAIANEWFDKSCAVWGDSYKTKVRWVLNKILFPWLGCRPIAEISPRELLATLRKTESRGAYETAHRGKTIAGQVFRYAITTGRAERDSSQDLRDALKSHKTKHFAAITDPKEVGELLRAIDEYSGSMVVKCALRLSPLVFQRPKEIRCAQWSEINFETKEWRIPAEKMKMKEPHIVPLSKQALSILQEIKPLTGRHKYVFPSIRDYSRPMSDNTINVALRALGYEKDKMSAHGFRAMARTIMDEVLEIRVDLIEHQLAHAVKDPNGRAYNRTAHLPARHKMMQQWADYLDSLRAVARGENVVTATFSRKT